MGKSEGEMKPKLVSKLPTDSYITVQCQKCGRKMCFAPFQVMYTRPCKCGNNNYGLTSRWEFGEFGNFKIVSIERLTFDLFAKPKPLLKLRLFWIDIKSLYYEIYRTLKWGINL